MSATPEPKPAPTADESSLNAREIAAYRRGLVDGARYATQEFRRILEEQLDTIRKRGRAEKPS